MASQGAEAYILDIGVGVLKIHFYKSLRKYNYVGSATGFLIITFPQTPCIKIIIVYYLVGKPPLTFFTSVLQLLTTYSTTIAQQQFPFLDLLMHTQRSCHLKFPYTDVINKKIVYS